MVPRGQRREQLLAAIGARPGARPSELAAENGIAPAIGRVLVGGLRACGGTNAYRTARATGLRRLLAPDLVARKRCSSDPGRRCSTWPRGDWTLFSQIGTIRLSTEAA
jgi:hypothetical protein